MNNRKFIFFIVVSIAVNAGIFLYFNSNGNDNHNETIIRLEKENLKLEHENSRLDTLILGRRKTSDSLLTKLNENQRIIQNLHYEIKEKINTINRMSDMELYLYFSNIKTDSTNYRK